jgi:hypothetical protein
MSAQREKVRFVSGDAECAAWHYPGSNGACVIMIGGFAVTNEAGTDLFARRLPGGHYAPFLDGHEQAVEAELSFLRRHVLDDAQADRAPAVASAQHPGGRS